MINHYRKVLSVRNKFNDVFQKGTYAYHDFSNSVICAFDISYSGKSYLLIHNVGSSAKSLTLASNANILADINTSKSLSSVDGTSLTIQGYASILLGA